jgi:DNA helicase-2/ATP-dependent DNA helicase PcrA
LVDFVNPITLKYADPYAPLLDGFVSGNVVVFDVESTGLDTFSDEVVELAAAKVDHNGRKSEFHAYLKNKKPVRDSFSVHGLSDEFLDQKGEDPTKALERFSSFCEGCVLVGHNVTFDKSIIESQGRRLGFRSPGTGLYFDTLDIARRLLRLPSYTLQSLCGTLELKHKPTHHAAEDVRTTEDLLRHLVGLLTPGATERRKIVRERIAPFADLAYQLEGWRNSIADMRPHKLLALILKESGLSAHWEKQEDGEKRRRNFAELVRLFDKYDDIRLSGQDALQEILLTVSLGNDTERLLQKDDRVLLVTVHQAKGLEFDTVFVAAATDDDFPSYFSKRDGRIDEELRVFYVAASRAKKRLIFSHFQKNDLGYPQQPSRFLSSLSVPVRY